MKALYMVLCHPGAAGVEHYREIYCEMNMEVIPVVDNTAVYVCDSDVVHGPRPRNLHLGGTPIAMTLRMVWQCLDTVDPAWHVVQISPDSMEYELAGFILFISSLNLELREQMRLAGWYNVPLDRWIEVLKPKTDMMRRAGMFGTFKDDGVYMLRKVFNLTYRRDHDADWVKEKWNRQNKSYGKVLLSGKQYIKEFYKLATKFSEKVVGGIISRPDSSGAAEWFERRHHHMPGGSTSVGGWIKKMFTEDERLGKNDRPNKKSVFEALGYEAYELSLLTPPINVARVSTKHEPGDKRRALYATNEVPYLLSSYASVHAEKEMGHGGSVARQSVDDFGVWLKACISKFGYWESADLSDYNSEHELLELLALNLARARAWLLSVAKYSMDKVRVSMWMAKAMMNTWVEFEDGIERVFSGLFSGSRDTMRDNTEKHTLDLELQHKDCREIGFPVTVLANFQAGDDEDTRFGCELDAAVHVIVMRSQNHNMNAKKQMAGKVHHEFLQVIQDSNGLMQRPLPALLATLASGNWYVPRATWFASIIQGVSDNWWEASVRGLSPHMARHMAAAYLDTIMRVRSDSGEWISLEWWDYRSPGYAHPLWQGVITQAPPIVREKPQSHPSWPSKSTDSWLRLHKRILADVPARKVELYREDLLQESHGSAFIEWRQKNLKAMVQVGWPKRKKRLYPNDYRLNEPGYTCAEMGTIMESCGTTTLPRDEKELAARIGVDPQIVALVGGWGRLARLVDGPHWAKYSPVLPTRGINKRAASSSWAFRSWASKLECYDPRVHTAPVGKARMKKMLYIYAPNGAGKTYLAKVERDWIDMDSISSKFAADRPYWIMKEGNLTAKKLFVAKILRYVIAEGVKVVMGQWPSAVVKEVGNGLGLEVDVVFYEPGRELREKRLAERGYAAERIENLRKRWEYSNEAYDNADAVIAAVRKKVETLE